MIEVWSRYHAILIGFAAALPIAVLAVLLRARALACRSGPPTRLSWWYAVCEVAAVYGTLPWLAVNAVGAGLFALLSRPFQARKSTVDSIGRAQTVEHPTRP